MRTLLLLIGVAWAGITFGQEIRGTVKGREQDKTVPLPYAQVYWANTTSGVVADSAGNFTISTNPGGILIASYIGYRNDSITVEGNSQVHFVLAADVTLEEVTIQDEKKATTISSLGALKTEVLDKKELKKAACCNLSESFETNPTVEVSYSDALTGIRQIQMLGLSGKYSQILVENMPAVRGLSSSTGMGFIPGPFVEQIHLSKGVGSVAYGYESMTGQINIGLKNPETGPKLFVNGYANAFGRYEGNFIGKKKINSKWGSNVLAHASTTQNRMDPNNDGFYNIPSGHQLSLMNRWKYEGDFWEAQIGVKVLDDSRISGQTGYEKGMKRDTNSLYGVELHNRQYGVWAKMGRPANEIRPVSFGFIVNGSYHESGFIAGMNDYFGVQTGIYATAIANRSYSEGKHVWTTGLSLFADDYSERFNRWNFNRTEVVPGAYAEYTYNYHKIFSLVAGLRADYHNLFGAFVTPRLHARYLPNSNLTLRAGIGRGQRTSNIFAENTAIFISSRNLIIPDTMSGTYGLGQEIAWNYGANATYDFKLFKRAAQFSADYYFVDFENQAVVDMDQSAREVNIYNLKGLSYSHTVQAQVSAEPLKRFHVRLAYRYLDVKTSFNGVLREQSLLAKNRGFINLEYTTKKKWSFDLTSQFIGAKRLPLLNDNPEALQLKSYSPFYTMLNGQISKSWKKWEVYLGTENLLNVVQKDLIIDADNPYSEYFDASMVWGPAMGRLVYLGFRYEIE